MADLRPRYWTMGSSLLAAALMCVGTPALAQEGGDTPEPAKEEAPAEAAKEDAPAEEAKEEAPAEAAKEEAPAEEAKEEAPAGDAPAEEAEQDAPPEKAKEEPAEAEEAPAEEAPADAEGTACEPTTTADIRSALEQAQSKFSALDVDGFKGATAQAHDDLPCLTDKFTRNLAAEYHRFAGLRSFVEKDPVNSTLSFAAARTIEPAYRFPESFVPPGNPVLSEYEAIDLEAGEFETVGEPKEGRIEFDGREALERPMSWPTLVQLFNDDGSVRFTGYLAPGDTLPAYDAKPLVDPDGGGGPNIALLGGGAGGLLLSGVFYGVASSAHTKYTSDATAYDELDSLRGTINSMQTASIAAGVVGLGLAGGSFVLGAR